MNEHNQIRGLLALAASGALDAGEQAKVDEHLQVCSACKAELASLQRITAGLGRMPLPQPSLGLAARTRLRVATELAARAERRRQHIWMTVLISFGWVLMVLTFVAGRYFADALAQLLHVSFTQFALGFFGYTLFTAVASAVLTGAVAPRRLTARRSL